MLGLSFLNKFITKYFNERIIYYWFWSWYVLWIIKFVPTIESETRNKEFYEIVFFLFVMLSVGAILTCSIYFLNWLYKSVNNLTFEDYGFGLIEVANIIFWFPIIIILIFSFFIPLLIKHKIRRLYFSLNFFFIYLLFLFFWRGKGLTDDVYFWLFVFPGIPISLIPMGFVLKKIDSNDF